MYPGTYVPGIGWAMGAITIPDKPMQQESILQSHVVVCNITSSRTVATLHGIRARGDAPAGDPLSDESSAVALGLYIHIASSSPPSPLLVRTIGFVIANIGILRLRLCFAPCLGKHRIALGLVSIL